MDWSVSNRRHLFPRRVHFGMLFIIAGLATARPCGADDLEKTFATASQSLDEMLGLYHDAVRDNQEDEQKELAPKIKLALREHLELGDRVRAQRIVKSRERLDRIEKQLVQAGAKIDSRVEQAWRKRSVYAIPSASPVDSPEVAPNVPSSPRLARPLQSPTQTDSMIPPADKLRKDWIRARAQVEYLKERMRSEKLSSEATEEVEAQLIAAEKEREWIVQQHQTALEILKTQLEAAFVELQTAQANAQQIQSLYQQGVSTASEQFSAELAVQRAIGNLKQRKLLLELFGKVSSFQEEGGNE